MNKQKYTRIINESYIHTGKGTIALPISIGESKLFLYNTYPSDTTTVWSEGFFRSGCGDKFFSVYPHIIWRDFLKEGKKLGNYSLCEEEELGCRIFIQEKPADTFDKFLHSNTVYYR